MGGSLASGLLCLERGPEVASWDIVPVGSSQLTFEDHYAIVSQRRLLLRSGLQMLLPFTCLFIRHLIKYLSTLYAVII